MKKSMKAWLIVSTLAIAGCGTGDPSQPDTNSPSVSVAYQSDPLADVEVSLYATPSGPVLARAVSTSDGRAHFKEIPSPEPSEYFVSLQSIGDGGWILDSKFSAIADSGLRLKPLSNHDQQRIELPRGAVRPLTSNSRK